MCIAPVSFLASPYDIGCTSVLCLQRALLHWTLMAVKLLKRSRVSEHLHIRYRTARMLEIWDLAASSIPASPVSLSVQLLAILPLHQLKLAWQVMHRRHLTHMTDEDWGIDPCLYKLAEHHGCSFQCLECQGIAQGNCLNIACRHSAP